MIQVLDGDITKFDCDALETLVNSGGLWFGGVDGAIRRSAGGHFHSELASNAPLHDGQVIHVDNEFQRIGSFDGVIFVVDDLKQPLSSLLAPLREYLPESDLRNIALPIMRSGVMLGKVEKTAEEVAQILVDFALSLPEDFNVTIVTYDALELKEFVNRAINQERD
jgi:O-acetyl-ADP-ribose deacetylase (regulator of RNase III)